MRVEHGARRAPPGPAGVRKLPISRKAKNPRLTRVESAVLLFLLVALSVIVFVGVSGATRNGNIAACSANASAVGSGVSALKAENSGGLGFPVTSAGWAHALVTGGEFIGAPFLSSWPKSQGYSISVAGAGAPADTGDHVVPKSGDVLVTVLAKGAVYDATVHVATACATV